MKTLPICVLIGICFIMQGSSEKINCYVCDDCGELNSSQLKSCPLEDTTNSPNTDNPSESTTISTEESTLEDTEPTTISPKPTETDQPITESSKPEATTVKTEEKAQKIKLPSKAQAPSSLLSKPEIVNLTAPASMLQPSQNNEPYQIFNHRGSRNSRSAPSYHCYSINVVDGDAKKVKKGCVEVPEDKSACDILKKEFGESVDQCKICEADKCNSCSTLKYSLITLVMLLVVSFYR